MNGEATPRETLTAGLRRRLRESSRTCPTCGQSTGDSLRQLAERTGVHFSTLHRFLRGGAATSDNLDRIAAFLDGAALDPSPPAEERKP